MRRLLSRLHGLCSASYYFPRGRTSTQPSACTLRRGVDQSRSASSHRRRSARRGGLHRRGAARPRRVARVPRAGRDASRQGFRRTGCLPAGARIGHPARPGGGASDRGGRHGAPQRHGRRSSAAIRTFDDLRRLRADRGPSLLVFAPHPFYRFGGSIGARIESCLDCFDAIEFCHFHVPVLDPNRAAARLARRTSKPLLATSDAHRLQFFGENYSLLDLPAGELPTIEAVFEAIRSHRVRLISPTGGLPRLLALLLFLFVVHPILVRLPGSKRVRARQGDAPEARRTGSRRRDAFALGPLI